MATRRRRFGLIRSSFIAVRLALVVSLIGLWLVQPVTTYACSCQGEGSPSEELEWSDSVFLGTVVSKRALGYDLGNGVMNLGALVVVEFDVLRVWKGSTDQRRFITTRASQPACGYTFSSNTAYLVYAYSGGVGLCSRTRPLERAKADLRELGEGQIATPAPTQAAATDLVEPSQVPALGTTAPTPMPGKGPAPVRITPSPGSAQSTAIPTTEISGYQAGGGCGLSPHTTDVSVMGLMIGAVWFGLRKRRGTG